MGFVVLAGLSALAALAALSLAARARLRGRAETLVAATLLWNAIVVAPIYALGLTGFLTARSVAVGSILTSGLALLGATAGVGFGALMRQTARTALGLLRLPADAVAACWRARSLVLVGVVFALLALPYMGLSAYLGQGIARWDPLWYHDTIVGFTIQNHGFAMVDLPPTLQKANGYPRLGEMTQLWMVLFSDRRLADATNLLFMPGLAAAAYCLARRYASAVIALGWGVAVVLMPACANLLHSTFVDPQNAALLLGGIVFATVDRPRLRDGWLAALGLALAVGSKALALAPVPVAGAIAAGLLLRAHWRHRRGAALATVAGGMVLIVAMASATYVRNYRNFHNPLWPDVRVDIKPLGIHWPGMMSYAKDDTHPGAERVDMNEPLSRLFDHLYALPWSVKGMYYDQTVDYGPGVPWIAVPMAAVALVACPVAWVRRRRGRGPSPRPAPRRAGTGKGRPERAPSGTMLFPENLASGAAAAAEAEPAAPPLWLAILLVVIVGTSPALWAPRYHIAAVGLVGALAAWLTGRPPRDRLGESAVAAVLVISVMMWWWVPSPLFRWWMTPDRLRAEWRAPPIVREVDRDMGAPLLKDVGLARERELGPNKLLVFNERYGAYPSLFWNNTFSNRIMYLRNGPDFLARAAKADATWVFLADGDPALRVARTPGSGWQQVGVLNPINGGFAFRRVPVTAAPPPPVPAPAKPAPPAPIPGKAAPPPATKPAPAPPPGKTAPPPATKPAPAPAPVRKTPR